MEHIVELPESICASLDQSVDFSRAGLPESTNEDTETTANPEPDTTLAAETIITEPAQSQVLRNPYILEYIFSFFVKDTSGKVENCMPVFPESQYLLWTSLTSKNMFDPAMNILWRSMESLLPILRLIPVIDISQGTVSSTGVITEKHVADLSRYTRRIRHVRVDSSRRQWSGQVPPEIYLAIVQILAEGSTTLIPCARTLEILDIGKLSTSDLSSIFLLPSLVLSEILIDGITRSTEVSSATLLYRAASKGNSVKKLKMEGALLAPTSWDPLSHFTRLEAINLHFDIGSTEVSKILAQISQMQFLKSVHLFISHPRSLLSPSPAYTFQALHDLNLSGNSIAILSVFQSIKQVPNLNSITIHVLNTRSSGVMSSSNQVGECIQHISSKAPNLASLQVNSIALSIKEIYTQHLASFTNLRRIDLPQIHLSMKMPTPQHWPAVKYLKLKDGWKICKRTCGSKSNPKCGGISLSLRLLPNILSICPSLETLLISVELATPLDIQKMQAEMDRQRQDERQASSHPLKELVLLPCAPSSSFQEKFKTTIPHAFVIARFIDTNFANLSRIDLSNLTEVDRTWSEGVEYMVMEFQKMRKGNEAASISLE